MARLHFTFKYNEYNINIRDDNIEYTTNVVINHNDEQLFESTITTLLENGQINYGDIIDTIDTLQLYKNTLSVYNDAVLPFTFHMNNNNIHFLNIVIKTNTNIINDFLNFFEHLKIIQKKICINNFYKNKHKINKTDKITFCEIYNLDYNTLI